MFGDSVIGASAVSLAIKIKDSLPDPDHIRSREASRTIAQVQTKAYSKECDDLMASMRGQWEVPVVAVNPMGLAEPVGYDQSAAQQARWALEVISGPVLEPSFPVSPEALPEPPSVIDVDGLPFIETPASIELPPVEATVTRSDSQIKIDTLEQEINDMFG